MKVEIIESLGFFLLPVMGMGFQGPDLAINP